MFYIKKGILYKNDCGNITYPTGTEIFNYILNDPNLTVRDENENLVKIRFSKVCLNTKVDFKKNDLEVAVLISANRRGVDYPIEVINSCFLDYIIIDGTWFYLNGELNDYKVIIKELNIINESKLTLIEYMNVIRNLYTDVSNIQFKVIDDVKTTSDSSIYNSDLKATLYNYQESGVSWLKFMADNKCGSILADEMGLGKTLQIIALIGLMLKKNLNSKFLIIAPVSLLENWKREFNKFNPTISVHINHGEAQIYYFKELLKYDVIITSYSNSMTNLSMYNMINWQMVILDEAQNIKNPYAKRTKAIKQIQKDIGVAITGTPFENHMTDLWSIMDFVLPNYFGTLSNFEKNFSDDIDSAIKVEKYLSPIMIRRRVKDVASDLPDRVDIPTAILMTEEEASYYCDGIHSIGQLNDLKQMKIQLIQKLRMFCTHPMVYNKNYEINDPSAISNKYNVMCDIIQNIFYRREKCLIFTSFNEMINIMVNDLSKRFSIYVNYINGSVEPKRRQEVIDEFSNIDGTAILVLNPKAAGAGLNITAANNVIHYNLDWNPALEDQASARSYRRGQEKKVFIYRLFYADTIEEIINERIINKRELSDNAVVGNEGDIDEAELFKILSTTPRR